MLYVVGIYCNTATTESIGPSYSVVHAATGEDRRRVADGSAEALTHESTDEQMLILMKSLKPSASQFISECCSERNVY